MKVKRATGSEMGSGQGLFGFFNSVEFAVRSQAVLSLSWYRGDGKGDVRPGYEAWLMWSSPLSRSSWNGGGL